VAKDPLKPIVELNAALDLLSTSVRLLFSNGQTTRKTAEAVTRLGERLGFRSTVLARWGEIILRVDEVAGPRYEIIIVEPAGVDMRKVVATMDVVDRVCDGRMDAATARAALDDAAGLPPISIVRFALMAGAGAAALGVIFGATHPLSLVLIALSAGAGACLRRWLAQTSRNLFVQPLCAAFLAGIVGALADRMQLSSVLNLIAVCPCMVLVPGPHLLNGTIDLARARLALGAARFGYAGLIILMICAGLHAGLALGGVSLSAANPSRLVPLWHDIMAAGVAVAAYGTFFSMPWRMLPIPIAIGMFAHACRWMVIALAGGSVEAGAFVACLVVGLIMTPVANRLRLPFAGVAFASVVSLMPGVFLFRLAAGVVEIVTLGPQSSHELLAQVMSDGATAFLIFVAMAFGLVLPKMFIDHFTRHSGRSI
jgi:uncharacterized membrane protein YjjP (DUF1212 family)